MTKRYEPVGDSPLLPGSFEGYLVTKVPTCTPSDLVSVVRERMVGRAFDCADEVVVCETTAAPSKLIGLIPMERLLAADGDRTAAEIMDADPPIVGPEMNQERAAWKAVHHGESSLAVLDGAGNFHGLIPPTRLLGALLRDHDEDFARLGGYLSSTASARLATEEPLGRRLWHRLPWLIVGLAGAAASAWMVGGFEGEIAEDIRVAFFVPGVVYMADAVGTQTEAIIIRGLSVGASLRRSFRLEALTGVAVGLIMGAVSFPAVWLVLGSFPLAAVVSLSLISACGVATVVAMLLPWLMIRLGRDPAFGSGPLATVAQDLLSLLIYFAIAFVLIG